MLKHYHNMTQGPLIDFITFFLLMYNKKKVNKRKSFKVLRYYYFAYNISKPKGAKGIERIDSCHSFCFCKWKPKQTEN